MLHSARWLAHSLRPLTMLLLIVTTVTGEADVQARGRIVVGHDINTFSSSVAGSEEATFAVNVATFLTSSSATKKLLLFESNPGNGTRDFAPIVKTALSDAGFTVTVTPDYITLIESFDAIFVAENYPETGFLDNWALISYVDDGGGVYLAGGVGSGNGAAAEAAGWGAFLDSFGLAFESTYNGISGPVPITGTHPIFAGVTSLSAGIGQFIVDRGTNPDASIVQRVGDRGVYAVVEATTATSTTTTTTTTSTTTTTTTLPSDNCDNEPVAPTFASIDCRLVALLARIDTTPGLGAFVPKLTQNVGDARDDVEAGVQFCAASDLKRTRQRLKQAGREMIAYVHRLNGHAARKKLPGLRHEFVAAGEPIKADLGNLKRAVNCPADVPAGN